MKKIEINNDRLASAVRTSDALAAFKSAVENGQSRLALDILEDFLPRVIERIDALEATETSTVLDVKPATPTANSESAVENVQKSTPKAKEVKATAAVKDSPEAES